MTTTAKPPSTGPEGAQPPPAREAPRGGNATTPGDAVETTPTAQSLVDAARFDLGGIIAERLEVNERHWLLVAPDANPAMLQIFQDRDRRPPRDLVPWAGEFAGKYLTSAVLCLRLAESPALREYVAEFVRNLIAAQGEDGYLGVWPRPYRLSRTTLKPDGKEGKNWDAWNHYHCMLGLLLWHEHTGDGAALAACLRAADYLCDTFLDTGRRVVDMACEEMNLSSIHIFALLYVKTGDARYLRMAREIEVDFEQPPAGDYVRTALAGVPFFQSPKPRWESLHAIQGVVELHRITGSPDYRRAVEHIWWSIAETDRHNNGGFSSGEKAQGNPYDPRAIETCCTIAWIALSIDMLRLTGASIVADEIELSTLNSVLGAQSPTGRWWTYDTPMDGVRKASHHDIVFQARAGSPDLNCCSVNAPRGLGMIAQWAVTAVPDGVALNYYGPGRITLPVAGGRSLSLIQDTRYPADGTVDIRVELDAPATFSLRLRIPHWSERTTVALNGDALDAPTPGQYLVLSRRWTSGDAITLRLDFRPRIWVGEREAEGKVSIYRGPLLLAYDQRLNECDPDEIPQLDAASVRAMRAETGTPARDDGRTGRPHAGRAGTPLVTVRIPTSGGDLVLCDFASAGVGGNPYRSWLPFSGTEAPLPFSRQAPLRTRAV